MSLVPSLPYEEIICDTLAKYTTLTDKDLVNDSLATEVKSCDSPTALCHVFQQHARPFDDDPMLMTWIKVIVDNLQALSMVPSLQSVCLSRFMVYITILKCPAL